MPSLIGPNYIVQEVVGAEYFIKNELGAVYLSIVQVHINASVVCEQFAQQNYGFIKPLKIRIGVMSPGVSVRLLFDHRGLLLQERIALGDLCLEGEVGAGV